MRPLPALRLGVLLIAASLAALVVGSASGAGGASKAGEPPRLSAPGTPGASLTTRTTMKVVITSPKANVRLTGKVPIRAKVVGRRNITRVEFRIDGKLRWTDTTAPYRFKGARGRWNTKAVKAGRHSLTVVAYDRAKRRTGTTRIVRVGGRSTRVKRGTTPPAVAPAPGGPSQSPFAPPFIDGPASVFVSTTGSDAAACTAVAPCRTFERAYRRAQPGQIVEVAGGTYPGQTIPVDSTKTSTAYVIFRPKAGDTVRLSNAVSSRDDLDVHGNRVEVRNMALDDAYYVHPGADSVVLRDVDVRRFFVTSATNVFIVGGDIGPMHEGASAIKAESATSAKPRNVVVDGAYFHDYTRDPGGHVECLQAWSIDGFVLRNSVFTRCAVFNVFVANLFQEVTNNALIENNFFDETIPGSGGQSVRIAATNSTFRYNSVLGSLFVDPDVSSNVRLVANVGRLTSGCAGSVFYEYNVWQGSKCAPTDVNAASGFVRPQVGNMDLHLTPGSAAVGRGKPGYYPATDIDGQARPLGGAPDAGADER